MRLFRHRIPGILAALLALMVQIAIGATVPRPDPVAAVLSAEELCHTETPTDGSDHRAPPLDCLVCPFCVAVHSQAIAVPDAPALRPPGVRMLLVARVDHVASPPPPALRPPGQPRAPPSA